jgi:hypothetical protein
MARIVTYADRYKRPPRKKNAAPLAVPRNIKGTTKGERIRRREAAAADRERSPEEREEDARAEAFMRRMMQPRD